MGLVAVSRLGLALHWAAKFWEHENLWTRRLALKPAVAIFTPFVDAPPWGIGGVLMGSDGSVLEYFADTISSHDVEILGIQIGSCKGQAILETLAILVALDLWQSVLGGHLVSVPLRSDNMAALALSGKMSSSSPT